MKPQLHDDPLAIVEQIHTPGPPMATFDLSPKSAHICIGVNPAMLHHITRWGLRCRLFARLREELGLWQPTRRTGI